MKRLFFCTIAIAALGVSEAPAATITSYNRASFQTAVSEDMITEQSFDSLAPGTILGTLNGVTYGASGGSPLVTNTYLTTTPPNGLGSTSLGYFGSTESASFTFATPITAFAIDINTFAPTAGDYSATLNLGNVVLSKFDVFPGTATGQFLGFISDTPFTSVTIKPLADPSSGGGYSYTLDTLVYGNASAVIGIPEPTSLCLLGVGLASLGFMVRNRRISGAGPRAGV